ncbi:hypothetical protein ACBJ59_10335 [Nonomuraea sp. MTCD27]|uniref:hypothetical protein n=1 Tax=Nonomuraea sp. MTCD27 TaxID=1676747 RepID=UPI0035C25BAF
MSRHRRGVPEYEIREVSNAIAPAVARRQDNGKVVVEVDERLHGRERSEAINTALELFRRGERALLPVPLLALMMDAGARAMREHQKAAAAVASATTAAAVGMATLTTSGIGRPAEPPPRAAITAVRTNIIAQDPLPSTATPPTPTRTRDADRGGTPPRDDRAEPADAGPPEHPPQATAQPRRPTPEPSPSRSRPRPTEAEAAAEASTKQVDVEETRHREPSERESRPAGAAEEPDPPTVDLPDVPDPPTPDPQPRPEPEPEPSAAGCGGIGVQVDVGDLPGIDVCLLG